MFYYGTDCRDLRRDMFISRMLNAHFFYLSNIAINVVLCMEKSEDLCFSDRCPFECRNFSNSNNYSTVIIESVESYLQYAYFDPLVLV